MATTIQQKGTNLGSLWFLKEQYGFNQRPLDIAYEAYFKSLLICANGDGTLADEERDWVIGLAYACDSEPAILEKLKVYKADEDIETVITGSPTSNESRRFLIYDAIQACSADGQYNQKERAIVLKGAAKLGISEDVVKQIEEIYFEKNKLREKRLSVLYPNGTPV